MFRSRSFRGFRIPGRHAFRGRFGEGFGAVLGGSDPPPRKVRTLLGGKRGGLVGPPCPYGPPPHSLHRFNIFLFPSVRGDRSLVNPGHLSAQPCMFTSSGAETGNTYQHPGTRPGTPHTYESCMNHLSSMNHHTEADHTETPNDQTLRHTQVSAAHNR